MLLALPLLSCLAAAPAADGKLHAWFFDVGHGDATLLVSPAGRSVLIDAGPAGAVNHLRLRTPQLAGGELDLVVLTHAADEHLGALAELVEAVGARRFLDPGLRNQGPAHAALVGRLQARGVQVVLPVPEPGTPGELLRIDMGGGAQLEVLWPRAPIEPLVVSGRRLQANSIVLRAVFGQTSLLLMGDAQPETEEYLLDRRYPLQSTLLKVSDHGAGASSVLPFLVGARPLAGIISVGPGNPLGAPARAVLQRLQQVGAKVFRTDLDGEIHAVSDGKRFTVTTERLPAGEPAATRWSFPLELPELPAPAAAAIGPGKVLRLEDPAQRPAQPATGAGPGAHSDKAEREDERPARKAAVPAKTGRRDERPAARSAGSAKAAPGGERSAARSVAGPGDERPAARAAVPEPAEEPASAKATVPRQGDEPFSVKPSLSGRPAPRGDEGVIALLVARKGDKLFHFADCAVAQKIPPSQMVVFTSRTKAAKKFKPAPDCSP